MLVIYFDPNLNFASINVVRFFLTILKGTSNYFFGIYAAILGNSSIHGIELTALWTGQLMPLGLGGIWIVIYGFDTMKLSCLLGPIVSL